MSTPTRQRTPLLGITLGLCVCLAQALPAGCASPGDRGSPSTRAVTEPELRERLLDLFRRDQHARRAMIDAVNGAPPPEPGERYHPEAMPAVERVVAIDAEASDALESIIAEHGWPTFTMVGADGANAAWLIAQHADRRPALQARALGLMREAVAAGEGEPSKLAYLTDRVLVARRESQRYGTQFAADTDGVHRPYPVEGPSTPGETLDRRRARVGLPPMSSAAREWGRALGVPCRPEPLERWPD